jgi:ribosomal RNA assembly protein
MYLTISMQQTEVITQRQTARAKVYVAPVEEKAPTVEEKRKKRKRDE